MNDNQGNDGPMDALLNRMRDVAREDDAAIGDFKADLTPLSVETRGRITRLILEQQAREKPNAAVDDLARRRLRSRRTFFMATGGMVAAAAALALWMRPGTEAPALPVYAVMATGGVMDVRGGPPVAPEREGPVAAIQRLRAQSELLVTCRPDTAVAGTVAVRAFLIEGQEASSKAAPRVSEIQPRVRLAATGAVELRIPGAELLGHSRGRAVLRVAVGRSDVLRALDGRTADAATDADGLRWLAVPLDLEASEP